MTNEEYRNEVREAYRQYQDALTKIDKEYVIFNNPYKVGDIVYDHIGYARIDNIKYLLGSVFDGCVRRFPSCIYECDNLTKKLEVQKREPRRMVYQSNVKGKLED